MFMFMQLQPSSVAPQILSLTFLKCTKCFSCIRCINKAGVARAALNFVHWWSCTISETNLCQKYGKLINKDQRQLNETLICFVELCVLPFIFIYQFPKKNKIDFALLFYFSPILFDTSIIIVILANIARPTSICRNWGGRKKFGGWDLGEY